MGAAAIGRGDAGPAQSGRRHRTQPAADGGSDRCRHREWQPMRPVTVARSGSPPVWRLRLALGVMGLLALTVFARAFYLQVLDTEFLSTEGDKRFLRTLTLEANRGAVRDRRGEPLALSAPVDSVWADPQGLLSAPEYLPALAKLMGWSGDALKKFLDIHSDK